MLPASLVLLALGLGASSLALVYLAIFCSIAWVPLLVVGLVKQSGTRRSGRQVA